MTDEYICKTEFLYRTNKGKYFLIVKTFLPGEVQIMRYQTNVFKARRLLSKTIVKVGDPGYDKISSQSQTLMGDLADVVGKPSSVGA